MGKIIDLLTGNQHELTVPRTYSGPMEQGAAEATSVAVDAFFQGKDPVTGAEISPQLRVALAPVAIRGFMDEVNAIDEARTRLR